MKRRALNARWRLESILLRSFRGVAKEQTIDFGGLPGMLCGRNGLGKSTVALCLQWTLYGKFPPNVLPNTRSPRFLAPIQGKEGTNFGEVTFRRGEERLTLRRGALKDDLTVMIGASTYRGEDAETKRDELLGLDMDTFARAVLLQQSRVRGLLMDDPKERNKALDRLLGLDTLEKLTILARSKPFAEAAAMSRSKVNQLKENYEARGAVLRAQRDARQRCAHELGFLNKHFNISGIRTEYEALWSELVKLGKKHRVSVPALSSCDSAAAAEKLSKEVMKAASSVRKGSSLGKRCGELDASLERWMSFQASWREVVAERDMAKAALNRWVDTHGSKDKVLGSQSALRRELEERERDLKAANALYKLLTDASSYIQEAGASSCPVCEQSIPVHLKLSKDLERRAKGLVSDAITAKGAALKAASNRLAKLGQALDELDELERDQKKAQRALERQRKAVASALDEEELAESRAATRIDSVLKDLTAQHEEAKVSLMKLEEKLDAICERDSAIQKGLLPVLQNRDELKAFEASRAELEKECRKDARRAESMDHIAAQLDRVREALLRAKEEVATESLGKAGPRALEIYRKLVQHPLFDTLSISTSPRAAKIDYAFKVSMEGSSKIAEAARHVLSDGQLTATALGLFFALAESTEHALDLLYIDDPTQNLDHGCKEAMADLILDVARRRQVIISTHDEDFVSLLESGGFGDLAVVHRFEKWDGNPRYSTTKPANGGL